MHIATIGEIGRTDPGLPKTRPTGGADGVTFANALGSALKTVENANQEANVSVTGMLNGTVDVHDAMIALHEAEEALEVTVAFRNKFVQAYQDVMRMGI